MLNGPNVSSLAIGFIGVGAMGEPMSLSLLRAGYKVTVSGHRNRERLERVLAQGAAEAADPFAVAAASDLVITCVPDAPQVEEALFRPRGAAARARSRARFSSICRRFRRWPRAVLRRDCRQADCIFSMHR